MKEDNLNLNKTYKHITYKMGFTTNGETFKNHEGLKKQYETRKREAFYYAIGMDEKPEWWDEEMDTLDE